METSVAEIRRYPVRPEGFEETLFPTRESRLAVAEHLLEVPWLKRASEIGERSSRLVPPRRGRVRPVAGDRVSGVYQRYGSVLHHGEAFLLEGRVEQSGRRGFAFLVERVEDLHGALSDARLLTPKVVAAPGAFVRAGRRGRRAG